MTISQEYAESIVNTVREPLIVLGHDLRVVTASRSFYEFFKVKQEETVGQLIYDLGKKQWDIPKLRELLETILPQKATIDDYVIEHDFKALGRRTLLLNARRIPSPQEKLQVILLAIEDITRCRRKDESAYTLAAIVNTSVDGIIGKNLQGYVISWNKAAEKIYGYTEEEMLGMHISLLTPPGYEVEIQNQLNKLLAGDLLENYETKRIRKDGVVIDISLTLSPIKDKSGTIYGVSAIMHDISEQKNARQMLVVSKYSESIINTVREPLIVLDRDLRVVTVSRSFYEFFKVKPEETIGQLIYDLGNKQWDIPKLRELLENILPQKASFDNYEVEHDFTTIGRRTMLLNARQIEQAMGKERIILLAIEDITERKIAEEMQDALSAYSRSLIEASLDPLVTISARGKITDVNEASVQATGVERTQLIGTDFSDYFTEPDKARAGYRKAFSEGFVLDYPLAIRHKTGRIIDVLYNASLYKDDEGNVLGVFAAARDVTEQKQASRYARSLIEASLDPLVTINAEGKITDVNEASVQATGVERTQLIGTEFSDYFTEPDKARAGYLKVFSDGFVLDYPLAIRHKTGRIIDVLYNASVYKDDKGNVLGVFAAARDVTERKEIEAGLEKAHEELNDLATELKRAATVKSEFLANMSHELRTPLNSINGFSEVLADETFGPLNEKQKKYVNNVLTSGKHLLLLINQILDMAKLEAGKMTLALSNLPMKSLLHEMSLLLEDMVSKKKIEMSLEIDEDLPNIEADGLKVTEIMYNLLSNAVKFTPEGGQIGLRAKKTALEIEIEVWDTGVGIAPENMVKIFEGFFRVDTPYSRVTEGTGLGLPLSRKLVEQHGGKLTVESKGLDKGTLVRFSLPVMSSRVGGSE